MKTFIILLLSIVVWGTTQSVLAMSMDTSTNPNEKAEREVEKIKISFQNPLRDVDKNLVNFANVLEIFEQFKNYNIDLTSGLLTKVKNHDTLSGSELFALRKTITTYYKINQKILDFAKVYDFGGFKMSKTFASENKNIPLIKAHLIWLSGHLVVLDHLEKMHTILYENDGKFRRIVKNALKDKTTELEGVSKTLNDLIRMSKYTVEIGESSRFSEQINLVRAINGELKNIIKDERLATLLVDTINTNETALQIAQGKVKFHVVSYSFLDALLEIFDNFTGWLSRIFGNAAGAIKWRKGYLYKNEMALELVNQNILPMDILIEKSPFTLTDKFIPGHYGHVAVYLGTKEQLEKLEMWNHPSIIPYREEIEKGKVVLEAVRTGVRLSSLEEFLNIDELTVMRKEDGLKNMDLLIEEVTRGMDQIGKAYDFNFDIATLDKIVCSELIYITFGNVHWPTQYRLGRATITPDDVAEILFQKNTKFKIQNLLVARNEHRIELSGLDYLAHELDYEMRAQDGDVIKDEYDETNSYWKKEVKCYNVTEAGTMSDTNYNDMNDNVQKRVCKTSYKEFYYEEKESI